MKRFLEQLEEGQHDFENIWTSVIQDINHRLLDIYVDLNGLNLFVYNIYTRVYPCPKMTAGTDSKGLVYPIALRTAP